MILVDTSLWIDHLRDGKRLLRQLLENREVSTHPFVIGELAVGNLQNRNEILAMLDLLPRSLVASQDDVLDFIVRYSLAGKGLGFVDVHLLASAKLSIDTTLWSKDKRLRACAENLSVAARV